MKILLIASITFFSLSIICFAVAFGIKHSQHIREKKVRHQPYVILDTEELIKPGDTLYVIAVRKDTMWLYGK